MVDQSSLENLLKVTEQYEPPQSLREHANLQDYEGVYRRSVEDPERFWAEVASQLEWHRTWDKVFEWDYPSFKWFLGAQCNITVNCLDRHLGTARRNKAAFIWLGEDGTERVFTYARLAQMVNRFANGLKAPGGEKGRPGGHLHAPQPRGVRRHAGLRPHRGSPQRRLCRLQRRLPS